MVKRIKSKITLTLVMTCILTIVIGLTYGVFMITTDKFNATSMLISNLMYKIDIKSTGGSEIINGKTVNLSGGNTSTVLVKIESLNPIDTNYQLEYKITEGEGSISYASNTGWKPSGNLSKSNGLVYIKTVKVVIVATSNLTVDFNVSGGYTHDNNIIALEGYNKITNEYDKIYNYTEEHNLKDIIESETDCTNSPCLYGGETVNNYLQYPSSTNINENIWRITGTQDLEDYVTLKLIGSIRSTTNVEGISNSLNNIYTSLEKKEDYIYLTDRFNCSETGCNTSNYENIGLLTTYEYNKVGGLNSYLASSNNFYSLNGENIENITPSGVEETNDTTTSGIRPVIYLQSDVNVTGSGTASDPYRLSSKGDIIMASATLNGGAFPNKPEGYFPSESDPYIVSSVSCTNGTDGYWDEEKKTIILTTPNLPTTCTVDFSEGYTITMEGVGATIEAPISQVVGRIGETSFTYTVKDGYTINNYQLICESGAIPSLNGNTINITNIKVGQKCTLILKKEPTLAEKIKEDNVSITQGERTDFEYSYTTTALHTATDYDSNGNFSGTTYYFTGNPNNWVSFAGKLWRIIRINGNGSVRLLYAGSGGEDGYITDGYNTTYNYSTSGYHPADVGWKYTVGGSLVADRGNANKSNIYDTVEIWYNGLSSTDKNYIDSNAIYCNDRSIGSGSYSISSTFYYGARARLETNKAPSLQCSVVADRFTTFGLMTADEVAYAGGVYDNYNSGAYYYLNKDGGSSTGNEWWWTMSPYSFFDYTVDYAIEQYAVLFVVAGSSGQGEISEHFSNSFPWAVRPVVSIKSCAKVVNGDGSANSPYELSIDDKCSGYNVTANITNGYVSTSENVKSVSHVGSTEFLIEPNEGYALSGATVTGGCTLDESTGILTASNVTSAMTCNVELKEEESPSGTLAEWIKKKYPPSGERTDFSNVYEATALHTAIDYDSNGNFSGTTYYFTGNPNNWVSFAGSLWRIIRINGNGSVRLLYAGSGSGYGYIGWNQYYATSDGQYNHPAYVGWKYTASGSLAGDRGNANKSNAYSTVETWYNELSSTDKNYIDTGAIYCNDRSIGSGSYSTSATFYYGGYQRLASGKSPSLQCSDAADRFTTFGLMTADEVAYAGGVYGQNNGSAYYYLNASGGSSTESNWWWTMSPYNWDGSSAYVFSVGGSSDLGYLGDAHVNDSSVVRPVVSLKSNVLVTGGNGSGNSPYTVTLP